LITLTEAAALEIRRRLEERGCQNRTVRIGLKRGGCSGTKYDLDLSPAEGVYEAFPQHGVNVVCEPQAMDSLSGVHVDFSDALVGGGFKYENPNAGQTCRCGASFSVEFVSPFEMA